MSDEFKGPFVFKRDEAGHGYIVEAEKADRFNELLYGESDDFEWADDRYDVQGRFEEEFGSAGARGIPNIEFYIKEE